MKGVLNFFLFSHLFIALCASSLYIFYREVLGENIHLIQLLFIFLGTAFAYNLIELFPSHNEGIHTIRGSFVKKHQKLLITLNSLFFIILGFLFFEFEPEAKIGYSSLFIMVLFYEGTFYPKLAFRKIPYVKSFYIALVWSLALFVPFSFNKNFALEILTFIEAFLFILTLCLAFDIRDLEMDNKTNLKTLMTRLGEKKGTYFCLMIFILQGIIAFSLRPHLYTFLGEFISMGIFYYLLKKVSSKEGDIWCYAGVDGLILLKWLSLLLHLFV